AMMPFADVTGLVTRAAQQARIRHVAFWERRMIVGDAIRVIISTREKGGPARRAQRKSYKRVSKTHAPRSEAIEVGRLEPGEPRAFTLLALHHPHRIPALIIGIDEKEVRFLVSSRQMQGGRQTDEGQKRGEKSIHAKPTLAGRRTLHR